MTDAPGMGTNGGVQGRVEAAAFAAAPDSRQPSLLARYLAHRRPFEIAYWVVTYAISALGNTFTSRMDLERNGIPHASWEPLTWEVSSHAVGLLLIAGLVWFTRRYPPHLHEWRRWVPLYAALSVLWSVLHVTGMVALREIVYAWLGHDYGFGPWLREFSYEYVKDVRTFAFAVLTIEGYRLILRRLQGEASLPDPTEERTDASRELPDRFVVRKLGREFLVPAADIEYVQAASNYVNLHARGKDYPLRSTIGGIEQRLDSQAFVRVHRSYIVNLRQIASIESLDTGDARLHLHTGEQIPCSRRYRAALRERLVGEKRITDSG